MLKAWMLGCSLSLLVAGTAHGAGDAANGEKVFKRCAACHVVTRRPNRVGPSLRAWSAAQAGTVEGFKYSEAMISRVRRLSGTRRP